MKIISIKYSSYIPIDDETDEELDEMYRVEIKALDDNNLQRINKLRIEGPVDDFTPLEAIQDALNITEQKMKER